MHLSCVLVSAISRAKYSEEMCKAYKNLVGNGGSRIIGSGIRAAGAILKTKREDLMYSSGFLR